MTRGACRRGAFALAAGLLASTVLAVQPKQENSYLDSKAYFSPEVNVSTSNVPVEELLGELANRAAWDTFLGAQAAAGEPVSAYVEPRTGAATSLVVRVPLIPGTGLGNNVSKAAVSKALGRVVNDVDAQVVVDLVRRYAEGHRAILGIDVTQLGPGKASRANENLWHVSFPQVYMGVPVRYGRLAANISHGNLVLIGTERWADVKGVRVEPTLGTDQALEAGFDHAGGRSTVDEMRAQPTLELVPFAPPRHQVGEGFGGPVGAGVQHYLTWKFSFNRQPETAVWEAVVDAHSGRLILFEDLNQYTSEQIKGGIYPLTNTNICPNNATCGTMQPNHPMPFGDTGLVAPNNFTNSAGVFQYTSGTTTTTFNGQFVRMTDTCGVMNQTSPTGTIDLGGVTGQHDCTVPAGTSAGNTAASRSGFYELNKLIEQAKGYLPANAWLGGQLTANMNINLTCNAFWDGSTVNFYKSGGGCGNTGEIAAVFDHEWGHGIDDNDTLGVLSRSSEGYADIASIYRLQASCVGHGFSQSATPGTCGLTVDGTGPNRNEAQTGPSHCDTDCSGVRDSDWGKHVDNTPDTAAFVCSSCLASTNLCGRQTHCAATPTRQAAWDFVARDLQASPFSYDSQTAFIIGNKVFYQGSGNIGDWHACTCPSTSDGCGATNGYMQWITADDDNGNLTDGTPHMTAIHAAFNRHNIACGTPTPANSGCAAGPTAASTLMATGGTGQVSLSWSAVPGAERYWVFRSEGYAGCNFGKALIADVTTLTYVDTQVANGRTYYYNVVGVDGAAAGVGKACYGRASNCANAMPTVGPEFAVNCGTVGSVVPGGSGGTTCSLASVNGYSGNVTMSCPGAPAGVSCGFVPGTVSVPAAGSNNTALTVNVASSVPDGSINLLVQGTDGAVTRNGSTTVNVQSFTVTCANIGLIVPGGIAATNCAVASPGAFAGTVNLSCASPPAGLSCAFSPASVSVSAGGSTSSTLTLTAAGSAATGLANLSAQGVSGALTRAGGFTANVQNYGTARSSKYDPALAAPRCFSPGPMCESGSLLNGRANITGGAEPNQPNTLGGTCADGTTGSYHVDESVDWLAIRTNDGTALSPGKAVTIEARVWVNDAAQDRLDLYFTDNTASPTWTLIGTVTPAGTGLRTLTQAYTLPGSPANFKVAIRANYRRGGAPASCSAGAMDDHDDLVFSLVQILQATYDPVEQAPRCSVVAAGCDSGPVLLLGRDTLATGAEPNQPNTIDDSCGDGVSGTFHADESLDRIKVTSVDGTPFAVGKSVSLEVTPYVWAGGPTSDHLEFYYTANATAVPVVWTKIGPTITPSVGGSQTFTVTYTLPGTPGVASTQAVRGRFRYLGTDMPAGCGPTTGTNYDDHDDLIFAVGP